MNSPMTAWKNVSTKILERKDEAETWALEAGEGKGNTAPGATASYGGDARGVSAHALRVSPTPATLDPQQIAAEAVHP